MPTELDKERVASSLSILNFAANTNSHGCGALQGRAAVDFPVVRLKSMEAAFFSAYYAYYQSPTGPNTRRNNWLNACARLGEQSFI
jgi:hypothetical protein